LLTFVLVVVVVRSYSSSSSWSVCPAGKAIEHDDEDDHDKEATDFS
jgi:hypothetical protein